MKEIRLEMENRKLKQELARKRGLIDHIENEITQWHEETGDETFIDITEVIQNDKSRSNCR